MSRRTEIILMVILTGIIVTLAIFALQFLTKPASVTMEPTPTIVPTIVMGGSAPTPYPRTLPPTWTPTAQPEPTATTLTETTPTLEPTKFILQAAKTPFTLHGSGTSNSGSFLLPAGRIMITWKYSGSTNEAINNQYAYNTYQIDLNYANNVYKIWADYYTGLIKSATENRDAYALANAQAGLDKITNEYNQNVSNAKTKYEQSLAGYGSPFVVVLKNSKNDKTQRLVNTKGQYSGTSAFTAEANFVYFFSVQSSGNWEIQVTPPK